MKTVFRLFMILLFLGLATRAANAAPETFLAYLSGANESPVNGSPGTGSAVISIDSILHTLTIHVNFAGLTSGTTASHIHAATPSPFAGTAGVATTTPNFAGFPLGVTAGGYDNVLDMTLASSYNPSFVSANGGIAGAETALFGAIEGGRAYLNIHTTNFGSGEVRGFLVAVPVPPAVEGGFVLLGGLLAGRWWKKRKNSMQA